MPIITLKPSGKSITLAPGADLLEAVKAEGVAVEAPCGGKGVCGKCLVRVTHGRVDFTNSGILPAELISEGFVLICRSKVAQADATLEIMSQLEKEQGKFSEAAEDLLTLGSALLPHKGDFDPMVKKIFIQVPAPEMGDGLSDYDRVKRTAQAILGGKKEFVLPLDLVRALPGVLSQHETYDGAVTLAYHETECTLQAVALERGDTTGQNFGVAIDIGTTTVAVHLVDLQSGEILASKTDYNAQIACGLDVISRINYAQKPHRLEELRAKILETTNNCILDVSQRVHLKPTQITNASIAGNTTMMHLLLGIPPESIRLEPYTPTIYWIPAYRAATLGIKICQNAPLFFAPAVGSYVGGDIASGLLCTALATDAEDLSLFIDIGTNGEIVFGNNEFLMGCACSAGPAFEGGGIEHGMRASHGAIERVQVNPETGMPTIATIGNEPPVGICGSGMISLIAELFTTGWIDAAGKLDKTRPCVAIEINGKHSKYILADAKHSGIDNAIFINEADIDNLIRAKAAIFSACRVLLQKVSMDFEDLSHIFIAGGFGRYMDIQKSIEIGLLPNLPIETFKFIGNASIAGAYMTLLSKRHRDLEHALAKKITYIDLSTEHEYMDQYTAALFLPHTDEKLFKGV